jgi:hypothetical protein
MMRPYLVQDAIRIGDVFVYDPYIASHIDAVATFIFSMQRMVIQDFGISIFHEDGYAIQSFLLQLFW